MKKITNLFSMVIVFFYQHPTKLLLIWSALEWRAGSPNALWLLLVASGIVGIRGGRL